MFGKKIILVGSGASGKDFLRQNFQYHLNLKYGISCTTRPPRDGEFDGDDYRFISKFEFEKKVELGQMLQYANFGSAYYGTSREDFENCNLFIMSPDGLKQLSKEDRLKCNVIWVKSDENIIYGRLKKRGMSEEEINDRLFADYSLFMDFIDYDYIIINDK